MLLFRCCLRICFFCLLPFFPSTGLAQQKALVFDYLSVREGLSQNTILGITKDKYGFMWFGTYEGVCRFDGYDFKVFKAGNPSHHSGLVNNRISNVIVDSEQNLWVMNGDEQVSRYSYEQEVFLTVDAHLVPREVIAGLSRENRKLSVTASNGTQWAIGGNGSELIQTQPSGQTFVYAKNPMGHDVLSDYSFTDLFLDDQQVLWLGTEYGGVNKADTRPSPFTNYQHVYGNPNSLVDNVVKAITPDRAGNLWIGTARHGISIMEHNGSVRHWVHRETNTVGLVSNEIRHLFCDRRGDIWIGTKSGLTRYRTSSKRVETYTANTVPALPHNFVFGVMEDHLGVIWIGTFNGIARFDHANNRFVVDGYRDLLNSPKVRAIVEDGQHRLWVATEGGGVSVLERDKDFGHNGQLHKVLQFNSNPNNVHSLPSDIVLAVAEDNSGDMWLGTNNGLCRYRLSNGQVDRVQNHHALESGLVMGLMKDHHGHIWVSHKKGLTRIAVSNDSLSFRTYTQNDGLGGNEFIQNAFAKNMATGHLMFGGTHGLTMFHPDSLSDNPHLPRVVLTSLRINDRWVGIGDSLQGRVVLPQSMVLSKQIVLNNDHRHFAIGFAGLHYSNPMANQYKYILEGYDPQWVMADADHRLAVYANVPPGRYLFKVMASNCDGVWNPEPAQLEVTVLPPWWRTWWAYVGYFIVLVAMVLLLAKMLLWRESLKRNLELANLQKEKEQELTAAKMEFFTHVSHELRTPLSLVVDPLEQLSNGNVTSDDRQQYVSLALQNARKLKVLIDELLEFRKVEDGKSSINLMPGDVFAFIRQLADTFAPMALRRQIDFSAKTQTSTAVGSFDADKLGKILSNIVSNAFKYTPDGGQITLTAQIIATANQTFLHIDIADTGIGIADKDKTLVFEHFFNGEGALPFEGQSSGIGLAYTQKLVQLLGGQIWVDDNHPHGSVFRVDIPFSMVGRVDEIESRDIQVSITSRPVVLVVDDQPDLRHYLANALGQSYSVLMASNGQEGLSLAIDEIPDVVVSDVMMPLMDGFDLCRRLKDDERTCHIPVVLLTAKADDDSRIEGFDVGAEVYHAKPFNVRLLQSQINSLLDNRHKLRRAFAVAMHNTERQPEQTSHVDPFLAKAISLVDANMERTDFSPDELADHLAVSKRQLYRKIDALTGQTLHQFITSCRMERAKALLQQGHLNVTEVAYKVGFTEPSNFSRTFSKHFGISPSTFLK